MEWTSQNFQKIPRQSNFPLPVSGVYYCNNGVFPQELRTVSHFEVSIRLNSFQEICRDTINGVPIDLPYPHTVFKTPGLTTCIGDNVPRDTLSFWYDARQTEILREWQLIPEEKYWSIHLDTRLEELIAHWRRLLLCYTSDGMIDQLDWVCFQILRELIFSRRIPVQESVPSRIRKAALFLEQHYDQKINCDNVAEKFGFSHASFYRHWKTQFALSPQEYLRQYRLKVAGLRLCQTHLSIADIVREIHYSSLTAFHREFRAFYGAAPAAFRHSAELQKKFFPAGSQEFPEASPDR